ncbi:hypothetical protein NSPZN2_40803 [Nitrospira defluvii]|uniref:Uncharacterized protein n=1 Tax=Nitrospira defluvii TaxID=330214 RepID=A0ABM8S0P7_9BACT|nr:hypothetical protein NSPZN2_40803 [Nitrospira defluvii]
MSLGRIEFAVTSHLIGQQTVFPKSLTPTVFCISYRLCQCRTKEIRARMGRRNAGISVLCHNHI